MKPGKVTSLAGCYNYKGNELMQYSVADLVTTGNEQRTLSLHIALIHLDHLH